VITTQEFSRPDSPKLDGRKEMLGHGSIEQADAPYSVSPEKNLLHIRLDADPRSNGTATAASLFLTSAQSPPAGFGTCHPVGGPLLTLDRSAQEEKQV